MNQRRRRCAGCGRARTCDEFTPQELNKMPEERMCSPCLQQKHKQGGGNPFESGKTSKSQPSIPSSASPHPPPPSASKQDSSAIPKQQSQEPQQKHHTTLMTGLGKLTHSCSAFGGNVTFNNSDVASLYEGRPLTDNALAFLINAVLDQKIRDATNKLKRDDIRKWLEQRVCIIDPSVACLMFNKRDPNLGPVSAMKEASLIFSPIAQFNSDEPENGYHWTLLCMQKNEQSMNCFFTPIHVDSLNLGEKQSMNDKFARELAALIALGSIGEFDAPSHTPQVVEVSPQQENHFDCGVFVALACSHILDVAIERVLSSGGNKSNNNNNNVRDIVGRAPLVAASSSSSSSSPTSATSTASSANKKNNNNNGEADWGYDQSVVTSFRGFMGAKMKDWLIQSAGPREDGEIYWKQ